MSDKNDGMIYWPDPADETTKVQTRGSNGCEWCVINLGRGDCTYINDLANCPFTDEDVVLLNTVFMALQQRKLSTDSRAALRAVVENPEYQLAAVKTCPKCKGKGCFPAARLMAGNTSFLTCNICRGKGLVIVDPEVEKPLPSFADVKGIFNNEETGGGE